MNFINVSGAVVAAGAGIVVCSVILPLASAPLLAISVSASAG